MEITDSFGYWVRRRRKALDLTQHMLADQAGCSVAAVKKIEADHRQPSLQLAERLADCLQVPSNERVLFLARARGSALPDDFVPSLAPFDRHERAQPARLPMDSTSFVGRSDELQQIAAYLADPSCRLLTLVGPGGIGKTRLALRAAAHAQFAHGVCFVPLAEVSSLALLVRAIAVQLDLHTIGANDEAQGLVSFLRSREMLLVFDNFEHLLPSDQTRSAAPVTLLDRILQACPRVKLLVTSRERLNLQTEWLLQLTGLPLEDAAVALFTERARRVQPSFALQDQEAAVAEICSLVEGMPLALELAAGWVQALSCDQIAHQLRQGTDLLSTRLRDVPERHRSLRVLFDGSWQLLTQAERDLFMQLAVFHEGFMPEEMEIVSGADMVMLLALVEKSLLRADGDGRYGLHELSRRYAAEQLAAFREADVVRQRHFEAYLALAETAFAHLSGPSAAQWLKRLDREQANLQAASDWAIRHAQDSSLLRLMVPLGYYWHVRGHWQEGIRKLQQALSRTKNNTSAERAFVMITCGTLLVRSGRPQEAIPLMTEGYALAQQADNRFTRGVAALAMSQMALEAEQRQRFFQEAIVLLRKAQAGPWLASALWLWGDELRAQNVLEQARIAYTESLGLLRSLGITAEMIYPLGNLGRLALLEGDLTGARASFAECVQLARELGNPVGLIDWLLRLGSVLFYTGEIASARAALMEALTMADEVGHVMIVPNIQAWLALVAMAENDLQHVAAIVEQSLDGYAALFVRSSTIEARDTQYINRPDFIEALIAVARVRAAHAHMHEAVVALSFAEKMRRECSYSLDPPLQKLMDEQHTSLALQLGDAFDGYWRHGQNITIAALFQICRWNRAA